MTDPSSPHPDLATWLEPAVWEALSPHEPYYSQIGQAALHIRCCGEQLRDWLLWREHVGKDIAAHIAQAMRDYPGELSHQEQDSPPMDDSRIRRARAFIDDARTSIKEAREILAELGDELTNNHLDAARVSANVAITYLNMLGGNYA